MGVVAREALAYAAEKGWSIKRSYCGALVTSLEMHGISITVLKKPTKQTLELLDEPTACLAWPGAVSPMTMETSITGKPTLIPLPSPAAEALRGKAQTGPGGPPLPTSVTDRALNYVCEGNDQL